MRNKILLTTLLLSLGAWGDVTLVSAFPDDVKIRLGEREESLGPRQFLQCKLSEASTVSVLDRDGKTLYQSQLVDQRFWVLHPKGAQEVGLHQAPSGSPRCAVGFFNATPYTMELTLHAEKVNPDPPPISIPSMGASTPLDIPSATFNINLKDEGGNPIGKSYSRVRGGHFYLIYRKRDTLYDLEMLGTIPNKP
jgi:hypothetical protein